MNSFGEKKKLEKLVSDNNQLKMGQNVRATRNVSHMGRRIICTANESPHTNMNWCHIMYEQGPKSSKRKYRVMDSWWTSIKGKFVIYFLSIYIFMPPSN